MAMLQGGGGVDTLLGGTRTLGGSAADRGLSKVDPRLVQIIDAAAARSPYDVQIFSGKRLGSVGGSRHNSGNAIDIALIDPTTKQVIPNYRSSTGFPIYADFAKVFREEQMSLYPDLADQARWGGGFSDKDFDLMHFDFKPGGAMAYWTWEDGGKLTPQGAEAIAKMGPGQIYYDGEKYDAPNIQYASLWGRDPLSSTPETAVAGLDAPAGLPGGSPNPVDVAMGYGGAPAPAAPAQQAIAAALTGASTDEVLAGGITPPTPPSRPENFEYRGGGAPKPDMLGAGPQISPRHFPASGPIGPTTTDGVLDMGPPARPENFQWTGGGAPDAASLPLPPSRASGLPTPPSRPDPSDPTLTGNAPRAPDVWGEQPSEVDSLLSMIAGRPETPGSMPAARESYTPFTPAPPSLANVDQSIDQAFSDSQSRGLARELGFDRSRMEGYLQPPPGPPAEARMKDDLYTPPLGDMTNIGGRMDDAISATPSADQIISPALLASTGQISGLPTNMNTGGFPGENTGLSDMFGGKDTLLSDMGLYTADPIIGNSPSTLSLDAMPGSGASQLANANPPPALSSGTSSAVDSILSPSVNGTVGAGSTGGEFFTPHDPMPASPPATSQAMQDQFNVAFSPGGAGQIMDIPGSYAQTQAPSGQAAIDNLLGGPGASMAAMQFASTDEPAAQTLDADGVIGDPNAGAGWVGASELPAPGDPLYTEPVFDPLTVDQVIAGAPLVAAPAVATVDVPAPNVAPAAAAVAAQPNVAPAAQKTGGGIAGLFKSGGGGLPAGSITTKGGGTSPGGASANYQGGKSYTTGTTNQTIGGAPAGSHTVSWQSSNGTTITAVEQPDGSYAHSYG